MKHAKANHKTAAIKYLAAFLIVLLLLWCISEPLYIFLGGPTHGDDWNVVNTAGLDPHQIHIAYGDDASEMVIMWATQKYGKSIALYGQDPRDLKYTLTGECKKFETANENGLHFYHRVKLTALQPGKYYYYRVHSRGIPSYTHRFKTPFNSNTSWFPTFLVYGDLGTLSEIKPIMADGMSGNYTAVLHIGDIAYDLDKNGGETGDVFMKSVEAMAARLPYMTCPGDHERFHRFAHYRHRFSMPETHWPMKMEKMWYSLNIGGIHLISYSTEVYFSEDQQAIMMQNQWLEHDLMQANFNRHLQPWIVVMGHRALYCSVSFPSDCNKEKSFLRDSVEDIFQKYRVNLVLQGHTHAYERYFPLYQGAVSQKHYTNVENPIYIITGMTGAPYLSEDFLDNSRFSGRIAFRMSDKSRESYGRLKMVNRTHLYWEAVYMDTKEIFDKVFLVQTKIPHLNISKPNTFFDFSFREFPMLTNRITTKMTLLPIISVLIVLFLILMYKKPWKRTLCK